LPIFNFISPKSYSRNSNRKSPSQYAINLKRDTVKKVLSNINAFKQDLLRVTPDFEQKYGSNKYPSCATQTLQSLNASISVRVVPNTTPAKCNILF